MIAENIQVKDEVLASGMYSEIKIGSCMGRPVAVKSFNLKVTNSSGDLAKLRKVNVTVVVSATGGKAEHFSSRNSSRKLPSGAGCPIRTC